MNVLSLNRNDIEDLADFFSPETLDNIGKDGYFAMAVTDDEDFAAGVMQFYIGEDAKGDVTAELTYLYVDVDFRNQGAGSLLLAEFRGILSEAGIRTATAEVCTDDGKELPELLKKEGFTASELSKDKYLYELKLPEADGDDKS